MRTRRIALAVTLIVACGLLAGFSTSSTERGAPFAQGTTTTEGSAGNSGGGTSGGGTSGGGNGDGGNGGVEVGGKVVERAPLKDPVDVAEMARTGSDGVLVFGGFGLLLAGVGLILVDLAAGPPARPRRTRAGLPRR
jgi:hypothetical protein